MLNSRSSGILLHPTSLPGPGGIGDLGPAAYQFVDFLASAGQRVWQVLPLGPTGYGDSPYQSFSAFAGNHFLIHLEDSADRAAYPDDHVHFETVIPHKLRALREHWLRHRGRPPAFDDFCQEQAAWLSDYSLFMACKNHFGECNLWPDWPAPIAHREPAALAAIAVELADEVEFHCYLQYLFFTQWRALRDYAHSRGVHLMGDLPIYVAHDSADVWTNPELFELQANGYPAQVAGVPPDYFSATGQLWGNPIYHWAHHHDTGYVWWIKRFRAVFDMVDILRLDHFRGFEAYWSVPYGEPTAINGQWIKGPGASLFEACEAALGRLPILAENLGVITPAVEAMRTQFSYPGMSILQFAFGNDPQAPDFKPHNFPRDRVVYTGTHDNDTTVGWWNSRAGLGSIRTQEDIDKERAFCLAYLHSEGTEIHWDLIRSALSSVANLALIPLQDVLGIGGEGRMNVPAQLGGNWRWRFHASALTPQHAQRLKELVVLYDR